MLNAKCRMQNYNKVSNNRVIANLSAFPYHSCRDGKANAVQYQTQNWKTKGVWLVKMCGT